MSTSSEGLPHQGTPPPAHDAVPEYTPDDRVAPEDASLLWPEAHLLAEPPPGYRPLEMPDVWEPDAAATASAVTAAHHPPQTHHVPQAQHSQAQQPWPYAPFAPRAQQPAPPRAAPEPRGPEPGYVISAQHGHTPGQAGRPGSRSAAPGAAAASGSPVLRSFRDLRSGPLEGREFATMREFAVAAVLEAGHPAADVARLFRFAPWQLRAWVEEARNASFGPGGRPAPGTGGRPA